MDEQAVQYTVMLALDAEHGMRAAEESNTSNSSMKRWSLPW